MNFASFPYLLFLTTVVVIYFIIGKSGYRNLFLLLASYFFYSTFGLGFMLLMAITTVITYYSSYHSYSSNNIKHRSIFFYSGLIIDLLIFILFKYVHIINIDIMNWPNWSMQKLLIPIGISFYTFKTIGYCIDVYKRKYPPESSFIYYALSVSFFPQLIAGPIEKSVVISSQFKQNKKFSIRNSIEGGKLILWGLFKKIVIADSIAQIINPIFSNIYGYSGIDFLIVFISFTFQIYADFSGYSDIAIGSAKCFNIILPANFDKPFFSKNISEFWRRWHISFYKWFKEYVYEGILNGNKKESKLLSAIKIGTIFLLVGLWHGATLNFMFYVMTAYIWLIVDNLTRGFRKKCCIYLNISDSSYFLKFINYVFIIMMISCFEIFFKGDTLKYSFHIFKHILPLKLDNFTIANILLILTYILLLETCQFFQLSPTGHCFEGVKNPYLRLVFYVFIIFSIILTSSKPDTAFQYFQF
jgi:alginate O-acetyltransferase complex protein AlgI